MSDEKLAERRQEAEEQVQHFVDLLKGARGLEGNDLERFLSGISEQYIERKRDWADRHRDELSPKPGEDLIDCAIRVFYDLNLTLPEGYITVKKEEDRAIAEFRDRCPILDACQVLGLDTRIVCRQAFHDPYQALLSEIDPRLRFSRDYENKIRPYNDCCVEIITVNQ